jgi:hypothetical protein
MSKLLKSIVYLFSKIEGFELLIKNRKELGVGVGVGVQFCTVKMGHSKSRNFKKQILNQ